MLTSVRSTGALALEYLELNLYETVVTRYSNQDFVNNNFTAADRATFLQIIAQEQMHIAALQAQVKMNGGQVIQPCNYSYGNAPTLKALLNATDAVNGLGPSAYIGAGGFLQSKLLLTAGAAIGNIETRHNSWLNGLLGRSEQPNAFQTPLSPTQAYGVASQFIINGTCPPSNANLQGAILAYPPSLNITNQGYPAAPLNAGSTLFLRAVGNVTAPRAAFVYGLNTTIVSFNASSGTTTIPSDVSGQAYVVLTTASQGQALNEQNSVTAPQAFYVDAPAQGFANYQVTTYDFLPGPGRK
ncbi:hypothetical protein EMMF5_004367 [Cystobasidiomycetes sp. EMM_F5]